VNAELITAKEYAERMGVSLETARRWARTGQVQSVKVGRIVRILWPTLEVGQEAMVVRGE
jgi:excisionase family DNA binding protein